MASLAEALAMLKIQEAWNDGYPTPSEYIELAERAGLLATRIATKHDEESANGERNVVAGEVIYVATEKWDLMRKSICEHCGALGPVKAEGAK